MTRRERQVLLTVNDTIAATGVSPSTAEIGAVLGLSPGVISEHVRHLVEAGYLRRRRYGRSVHALDVLRLPGNGLTAAEMAWCIAQPERVRAMMRLAGVPAATSAPQVAGALPEPAPEQAVSAGIQRMLTMDTGEAIEIDLPGDGTARRRCYQRLSTIASRLWGPRGARRQATRRGMRIERAA